MTPPLSMSVLAQRWSEYSLADITAGEQATRVARETGSLLRPPAAEAAVQAVEKALGRALPPSYREFLLVSNGAYGDLEGVTWANGDGDREWPSLQSDIAGIGFLPVEYVRWLRDAQPDTAAMYAEAHAPGDPGGPALADGEDIWPWSPFANGLLMARDRGPGVTCLVPFDDMEEWQVWDSHKDVAVAFLSFRSMLEDAVARLTPIASVTELRQVFLQAAEGDSRAANRLSHTTAPDAVPVLVELLERDSPYAHWITLALGRLGTPPAVEALGRLRPRGAEDALMLAGTEPARQLLVDWGRHFELSLLHDARAPDIAARYIVEHGQMAEWSWQLTHALHTLQRSGDKRFIPIVAPYLRAEWNTDLAAAHTLAVLGDPRGRERLSELAAAEGPAQTLARHWLKHH